MAANMLNEECEMKKKEEKGKYRGEKSHFFKYQTKIKYDLKES